MNTNLAQQDRVEHERVIADLLSATIQEATGSQVLTSRQPTKDHFVDLLLNVEGLGQKFRIAVEVLREAYPRDVREAVWQLDEFASGLGATDPDIARLVAAKSLSSGAKEALKKRGIGYFEQSGTLFLRHGHWLINIERPSKKAPRSKNSSIFTDARESVVHALLKHRDDWITGGDIANLAKVSTYTTSIVLQELERREWIESSGAGRLRKRHVSRPSELLNAWAEEWRQRKDERTRYYLFAHNPSALLEQLSSKLEKLSPSMQWAFTGTAAANILAPLLTSVETAEIIVPKGASEQLARELNLKPAEKGANVTLIERDGAGLLFRREHPEIPSYFASPIIIYLDLLDDRGRNKELAEHFRKMVLKI